MRFSVLTLVNDPQQYADFARDLDAQQGTKPFERIEIANTDQRFASLAQGVNPALDQARGEYLVVCHQDLRVPSDWLARIDIALDHLAQPRLVPGIVGLAGAGKTRTHTWAAVYLSNLHDGPNAGERTFADFYRAQHGDACEVQCLDELCLVFRREHGFRFDERTCDHFHWYGADLCLEALSRGLKNYAINAPCLHASDGISKFVNPAAARRFREGSVKLFKKWSSRFPYWKTTTTEFSSRENEIYFEFAARLRARYSVDFPECIQGI